MDTIKTVAADLRKAKKLTGNGGSKNRRYQTPAI